jgi:hypothetical protein
MRWISRYGKRAKRRGRGNPKYESKRLITVPHFRAERISELNEFQLLQPCAGSLFNWIRRVVIPGCAVPWESRVAEALVKRLEKHTEDGKARAVKRIPRASANLSNDECKKKLKALLEFSQPRASRIWMRISLAGSRMAVTSSAQWTRSECDCTFREI